MKYWITADHHLGDDRFKLQQRRGFKDAQDMLDKLVKYHNELVAPEDVVYFVGDVVNQKTPEFLDQVSRFNGKKTLFRGNHDRVFTDEDLAPYFDNIYAERDGMRLMVNELPCWVQHYPTEAKENYFNLVGHVHSAWKVQLNAFNVGVDCNHFRPHDVHEAVPFMFDAICKFYDQDVWVAYNESNAMFQHKRGKKGRYLDVKGFVGG
jgi:calcineurin-like phosphoesterase family protein